MIWRKILHLQEDLEKIEKEIRRSSRNHEITSFTKPRDEGDCIYERENEPYKVK